MFFRLVAAGFAFVAAPCMAGQIELHRSAAIAGPVVLLGDVATLEDATLAATILGPRTTLQTVSADLVRQRLTALGRWTAETQLTGASRCELTRPVVAEAPRPVRSSGQTRQLAERRLAADVRRRILAAFPDIGPVVVDVTISDAAAERLAAVPAGLSLRGGHANWRLPQAMEVVLPNGETVRFLAHVRVPPQVAVAAVPLTRGQIVLASHVEWRAATEASDGGGIAQPEQLVGHQVVRPLQPGQVVHSRDVAAVRLVRPGDVVSVRVRGEGFEVRRVMRARSGGAKGDAVTLVDTDGRKTLTARVVDHQECEVLEGAGRSLADLGVRFETPTGQGGPQ